MWLLQTFIYFFFYVNYILSNELTFELPDNAKECFYRNLNQGDSYKFEYQVISGGQYDIDLFLYQPKIVSHPHGEPRIDLIHENEYYMAKQKQFDSLSLKANITGTYAACFSNEFSSFSHKLVYFNWAMDEDESFGKKAVDGKEHVVHPLTMMESATEVIHDNLNEVTEHQTHYRLNEASGRIFAEELNNRVMVLSLSETIGVLIVGIGQIIILRNFFTDKRIGGGR